MAAFKRGDSCCIETMYRSNHIQILYLGAFVVLYNIIRIAAIERTPYIYSLLEVYGNSSGTMSFDTNVHVKKLNRIDYGVDGYFDLTTDIDDENLLLEVSAEYSKTRDGEYKTSGFSVPKQNVSSIYDNFYKRWLVDTLKDCSNLPTYDGPLQLPLEKKRYEVHDCVFTFKNTPNHMPLGYFKICLKITGVIDATVFFTFHVSL